MLYRIFVKRVKLHLGCGSNVKEGYINIDKFIQGPNINNFDILKLPFSDKSCDEILAEHIVEHLSFSEEKQFFFEAKRLLVEGGILIIEVPDMEWVFTEFVKQVDSFKDFYQVGAVDHYFGNGIEINNRWGVLTTHIWGNQNGEGQFHKNGYTEGKLRKIGDLVGFSDVLIRRDFKKKSEVLICTYTR